MIEASQRNWSLINNISLLRRRKNWFGCFGVCSLCSLTQHTTRELYVRGMFAYNSNIRLHIVSQNANSFGWIIICDQFMIRCDRWMWKMITFKAWPYQTYMNEYMQLSVRRESQRKKPMIPMVWYCATRKKVWNCIELWMKSALFSLCLSVVFMLKVTMANSDDVYICIYYSDAETETKSELDDYGHWVNVTNTNIRKIYNKTERLDQTIRISVCSDLSGNRLKMKRQAVENAAKIKFRAFNSIWFDTWAKWSDHSLYWMDLEISRFTLSI